MVGTYLSYIKVLLVKLFAHVMYDTINVRLSLA